MLNQKDPLDQAMNAIEKRFGVPFWEYMKGSKRSPEVQNRINRALQKETLYYASKSIDRG